MPASAAYGGEELTRHNSLEDQRALQVALELSLLSFGGSEHHDANGPASAPFHSTIDQIASLQYADEMRFLAKKSQNMTECVPVPSSEHVAEIVGRQGNAFISPFPRNLAGYSFALTLSPTLSLGLSPERGNV